jgi:tetratricopeptide (TPR) repeat protein
MIYISNRYFKLVVLVFSFSFLQASELDSLYNELNLLNRNDINRVQLSNVIASRIAQNNMEKALALLDSAEALSKRLEYDLGLGNTNLTKSKIFYFNGSYELAIINSSNSLKYFKKISDTLAIANVYSTMASIYYKLGNYQLALRNNHQALSVYKTKGVAPRTAVILNNIGLIYKDIKDFKAALKAFEQSIEYKKEYNSELGIAITYNNIGELYFIQDDLEKASTYFHMSMEISEKIDDAEGVSLSYLNLGRILSKQGDEDKAIEMYNKAIFSISKKNDKPMLCSIHYHIGQSYLKTKDDVKALKHLLLSLEMSKEMGLLNKTISNTLLISEIYNRQGSFNLAYHYLKQYNEHVSLFQKQSTSNIILKEKYNYEYENKEKQLRSEFEYQQKIAKMQENKRLNYFMFAILGLIIVSLIFVFLYVRSKYRVALSKEKQEKLKLDIEHKNRVITYKMMTLTQLDNQISDVIDRLKKVKFESAEPLKKELGSVINDLKFSQNDNLWNEFETYFCQIHPSFYDNLLAAHPDMTSNDKKMCAFLKLNMNTKEIATITNNKPSSVDMARSRLRKKLNLNSDVSLSYYLNSL